MTSAVLDANTIASGILGFRNQDSSPGRILQSWRKNMFTLVTSEYIRAEVKNVLRKPYFTKRLTPQEISRIQALLKFRTKQIKITKEIKGIATHPEDDLVLATAVCGKADYLVTGDDHFLQKVGNSYQGVTLITPNDFLEILKKQS